MKGFFSVCHMMGYDGDVSLEMEDLTMTVMQVFIPRLTHCARPSASNWCGITDAPAAGDRVDVAAKTTYNFSSSNITPAKRE